MSQMTQQYKGMQVQMMKTLQDKDNRIAELTASLEEKDKELEDTKNERDKAIAMKEAEIAELKEKVNAQRKLVMSTCCVTIDLAKLQFHSPFRRWTKWPTSSGRCCKRRWKK